MPQPGNVLHHSESSAFPRRHYAHPPVIEALVDLGVDTPANFDLAALDQLCRAEAGSYPERKTMLGFHGSVTMGAAGHAISSGQETIGFQLFSASRGAAMQLRRDGFAFSRLPPYDHWERWRGEAQRLWELYRAAVGAEVVTRLAVRYINRLDLPTESGRAVNLSDYLRIRPEVPADMPSVMNGFLLRVEMPQPGLENSLLVLSEGRVEPPNPSVISILLDLDLSQSVRLPVNASSEIWSHLEILHARENDLFELCITPRARAIFGQV